MARIRLARPPLPIYRYQRKVAARMPQTKTVAGATSDTYPTSRRTLRNIARKGRRLRLAPLRLGRGRRAQLRTTYGFPWVSDAQRAASSRAVRNAMSYVRRRPR